MRVADLMHTDVVTIPPDATIGELVQSLADAGVSGLPVVSPDGQVIGVGSAADVLQAGAEQDDARARRVFFGRMTVRDVTTRNPHVIEPDTDARDAAKHMLYADVRRLFVQDRGRLVGVISQTDIAQAVGSGRL